ncbi:short-chain dehydrogenase [Talaromyces proteolyticus]|uniref:Short-chain dehydrogenase n=1 Tax=Talaromyces proteolyticus TaxID=1131652 RepID=A0AAD4PYE4_9EURO|nr:short-chain dehydrogenase [Talaromyces proteolyticus]KAH8693986.1 short-chain dehydrogenase [Talaromyces proteolyticus]
MSTYLITGVSRGIGFAFLRHISADPNNTVIGLVRDKTTTEKKVREELDRPNIHIIQADLTDLDSLKKSVDQVSPLVNGSIDYLIANAGYMSLWSAYHPLSSLGNDPERLEEDILECFRTNVVGNVHLFNLYMPLILKGHVKKVIAITSGFADDDLTTTYAIDVAGPYSISKAAMNTAVAKFSAEYAERGVLFMGIAPGAVEVGQDKDLTEEQIKIAMALGEKFARYAPHFRGRTTPEESVKDMMSVINAASLESGHGGCFISQHGNKKWL